MVIETQRLILRELTLDDFDDLYSLISNPITMSHYEKPYDLDGCRRWLNWCVNSYKKNGFGLWAMILKENNQFIGDCGLSIQNIDGVLLPEVGYHIKHEYWRNGYGKEAGNAVIAWAFKNTKYESLYSYMTKDNIASYSTAISLGMKKIKEYKSGNEELLVYKINKTDVDL